MKFNNLRYTFSQKATFGSLVVICLLAVSTIAQEMPTGSLVIVGGGLNSDNKEVFTEMIRLAGGAEKAVFAVIPVAGSSPVQSFQYYHQALMRYGIREENIHLIKLSLSDDDSTTLVNEALWKDNSMNPEEVEKIRNATAVWFTGGDQMCILRTLVNAGGGKSLMLEAVWEVYNKGGMIGGTSAGAAIMSNPMIGRGNSLFALTHDTIANFDEKLHEDSDTLFITRGLGFFPFGIVDQHFHQRARIGRLVTTMMIEKKHFHLGFGIDENTALIYDGNKKQLKVAGASGVTIIDVSNAETSLINNLRCVENLNISYLENGDCFDLSTREVIPASEKILLTATEKRAVTECFNSGSLSTFIIDFKGLITHRLFDNTNPTSIEDINIIDNQTAYLMRFSKISETQAYKNKDTWTIKNVRLDIFPAQISLIFPKQIKTK